MQEKFKELFTHEKTEVMDIGFGNPFLKFIMSEINENDIIHYVDIGCHIQNKNTRFYEYLDFN